jgi:hypothetical protein
MSLIVDGTTGVTFNDSSLQGAAASPYVLKNRIINGAMVIDQRNAGASVTPGNGDYTLDRWRCFQSVASKYSVQQNAAAVTPPTGFTNYLGVTSLSAYTPVTSDYFMLSQAIEGLNVSDLAWGTANAKTVTLSFWVRSSLTGNFGVVINNNGYSRAYPILYNIPSANTWTQISITIPGDTTGTWLTTNGIGLMVMFSLGAGPTSSQTSGSWTGTGNIFGVTGATSVVGTNGATFYLTGVQLEIGTSATPFERRLYGQELINCQRYYEPLVTVEGYELTSGKVGRMQYFYKVSKRATPTITLGSASNGAAGSIGTELFNLVVVSGTAAPFTGSGGSISIEL